jgi:DNA repair protein RAD5
VTVFLISLKAGGVGLNLVAANTVFFLDCWWNPVHPQCSMRVLSCFACTLSLTPLPFVAGHLNWLNNMQAVEDQAIQRVHRIGQTKTTYVRRFVVDKTVEQRILELHSRKKALASSLSATPQVIRIITPQPLLCNIIALHGYTTALTLSQHCSHTFLKAAK